MVPFKLMDEDLVILWDLKKEKRTFCAHQTLPHSWSHCTSLSCAVAGACRWLQQVRPENNVIVQGRSPVCPHACFAWSWPTPLRSFLGSHRNRQPLPWVWGQQWETHSSVAFFWEKCGCRRYYRGRHTTHTPQTHAFIPIHGFLVGWWWVFLNSCINRFGMWHRHDLSPVSNTPTLQLSS